MGNAESEFMFFIILVPANLILGRPRKRSNFEQEETERTELPLITSLRSLCFLLFKTNREPAARNPFFDSFRKPIRLIFQSVFPERQTRLARCDRAQFLIEFAIALRDQKSRFLPVFLRPKQFSNQLIYRANFARSKGTEIVC